MFQCHARSLLEFRVVLSQGVGVEEQSLGRKAAVNEGRVPRATSVVPTANSPPADGEPSPSYLPLNSQAMIQASWPGARSGAVYYTTEFIAKNAGPWAGVTK